MQRLLVMEATTAFLRAGASALATVPLSIELEEAPAPATGQTKPTTPYSIVYTIPGTNFTGSFAEPVADAQVPWQVTSVGRSASQADWMADLIRAVVTGPTRPTVAGLKVIDVELDGGPANIDRGSPDLFSVAERFIWYVTPA